MAGARLQCTMLHAGAPARRLGLLQAHCSYSAHQGSANVSVAAMVQPILAFFLFHCRKNIS